MKEPHNMTFPGLHDLFRPWRADSCRVVEGQHVFTGRTSVVQGYRIFVGVHSDTDLSAGTESKTGVNLTLETETTRKPETNDETGIKNYLVDLRFEPVYEVLNQFKVQEAILKERARGEEMKMKKETGNSSGWRKVLIKSTHLKKAS